jgi:hypothetical protein
MEDPITFDLWGMAVADHQAAAIEVLTRTRRGASRITILKDLVASKARGEWMLIAEKLAWNTVEHLRVDVGRAFGDVSVYQSGYRPEELPRLQMCSLHRVAYGGVLGCPVCGHRAVFSTAR